MDIKDLLKRGGIWYDIPGNTPETFINALIDRINLPENTNRKALKEKCLQREAQSSTAMGNGVAFPHPGSIEQESDVIFIALAYPRFPVNWNAPDGLPVKAVFLIMSPDRTRHLEILSSLAKLCSSKEFLTLLDNESNLDEFFPL